MPDFSQGKIYKIVSDECDAVYYGSTTRTLMARLWRHKSKFNEWKNNGGKKCAICKYFDEYGFDNFRIELVEDYPCDNGEQLRMKEQEYLDANECVNEQRAYTSPEDARIQMLKYQQDYYQEHQAQIKEKHRIHHHANKEKISEQKRIYRNQNKEKISERGITYRNENKEAIAKRAAEKVVCECGREVRKDSLARHRRTAFHQEYLNLTI